MKSRHWGWKAQICSAISMVSIIALLTPTMAAAREDVVIFDNGDRLTGEVKSLERGRLRFKTEATDTISIEWDNVAFLSSVQNIQLETINGQRVLGRITMSEEKGAISLLVNGQTMTFDAADVVLMTPIEEAGLNRLDGDITFGYNFAKASAVEQTTLGLGLDFRTEQRVLGFKANSSISDSSDTESSQRHNATINYKRLLPDRWLYSGFIQGERNDELGIDARFSIGAGFGRIAKQTNHSALVLEGGLMLSRENLADATEGQNETVEAYAGMTFDWFRYDSPELDLSTSLTVIPSLSESGRVRANADVTLKWEIISDLFWQLSFYDSYDSQPGSAEAEKNDFGVNTSIGYDF